MEFCIEVDMVVPPEAVRAEVKVENVILEYAIRRMFRDIDEKLDTWSFSWDPVARSISEYRLNPLDSSNRIDGYYERACISLPHPSWDGRETTREVWCEILNELCNWWFWNAALGMCDALERDFGSSIVGAARSELVGSWKWNSLASELSEQSSGHDPFPGMECLTESGLVHDNDDAYLHRLSRLYMSRMAYEWYLYRDSCADEIAREFNEKRLRYQYRGNFLAEFARATELQSKFIQFVSWRNEGDRGNRYWSMSEELLAYENMWLLLKCPICFQALTEKEAYNDSLLCMFCDGLKVRRMEQIQEAKKKEDASYRIRAEDWESRGEIE